MIYLLDTNAVSDWLGPGADTITQRIERSLFSGDQVAICQLVYYELVRGLLWKQAEKTNCVTGKNYPAA